MRTWVDFQCTTNDLEYVGEKHTYLCFIYTWNCSKEYQRKNKETVDDHPILDHLDNPVYLHPKPCSNRSNTSSSMFSAENHESIPLSPFRYLSHPPCSKMSILTRIEDKPETENANAIIYLAKASDSRSCACDQEIGLCIDITQISLCLNFIHIINRHFVVFCGGKRTSIIKIWGGFLCATVNSFLVF